jgi:tetratricopeptide (TPR) repeat protein
MLALLMSKPTDESVFKAQEAFQQRNWAEAADIFERILQRAPDCFEAWVGLAHTQTVQGKIKAAVQSLRSAVELRSAPEQLDEALGLVARLLELDPHNEDVHLKRIDLLFTHGRVAEGIALSRSLAQHLLNEDNGEVAIKVLVRAFQIAPQDAELTNFLAEAYLAQGQLREATGLFRQILPSYIQREEYERAAQILRRMSVVNQSDMQTPLELGDLYIKMGRLQEADQQFRTVLRQDINNREALLRIANVSTLRSQFRDAAMVYNRLLSADSEDLEARHGLGRVYKMQGMQQDAIKHLLMAGLASLESGDKGRAAECFGAVLEIDPENRIAVNQMKVLV